MSKNVTKNIPTSVSNNVPSKIFKNVLLFPRCDSPKQHSNVGQLFDFCIKFDTALIVIVFDTVIIVVNIDIDVDISVLRYQKSLRYTPSLF